MILSVILNKKIIAHISDIFKLIDILGYNTGICMKTFNENYSNETSIIIVLNI